MTITFSNGGGLLDIVDSDREFAGRLALAKSEALQVRDALIAAYPLEAKEEPDDLTAANKLNEEYQFRTFGMGATVGKDEADPWREYRAARDANPLSAENARLRDKIKRLKRALKGALK